MNNEYPQGTKFFFYRAGGQYFDQQIETSNQQLFFLKQIGEYLPVWWKTGA